VFCAFYAILYLELYFVLPQENVKGIMYLIYFMLHHASTQFPLAGMFPDFL